ncbi:peptidase [Aquimarina aquimarini]|uniref:peptidase n=1 Tax=Aquimarina aquimarini TaxID=1191734 RepID=UPI000D54CB9A|nr:peptidase [Aquimarina aquimarini]
MFDVVLKSKPNEDICFLIKAENHSFNYICECGEASDLTVKECQNTNALFISHTHIDHFINFDTILRHQIGIQRRVVICGPKGITDQIQKRIQSYCWNLIDKDAIVYEIREILSENSIKRTELNPPLWNQVALETIDQNTVYENELFEVTCTILNHKTDSIAYLFQERNTTKINLQNTDFTGGVWVRELKYAYENSELDRLITIDHKTYKATELFYLMSIKPGQKLGFVMDHAASETNHEKIITIFKNADRVYIESFYKSQDQELAIKNHHSYSSESGRLMKLCNVTEAIPVHFSRKYSDEEIQELITEFATAYQ